MGGWRGRGEGRGRYGYWMILVKICINDRSNKIKDAHKSS
jgi:hypothetical protein